MSAVLSQLTDEEIEYFASLPRRLKCEMFALGEQMYDSMRDTLARAHPGKTLAINLADNSYVVGENLKDCTRRLAPPCRLGQNIFVVTITPRSK